jgi:hypothetical protein
LFLVFGLWFVVCGFGLGRGDSRWMVGNEEEHLTQSLQRRREVQRKEGINAEGYREEQEGPG